ncbi:DctP family TRAP transporter solute-binding subunit [Planococcus koreensis]|uniref:DctP family TRAP transporter solute-binding subunit n=2 Tax=Planococcus TaxID=1372 RepID=UPI0039FD5EF9
MNKTYKYALLLLIGMAAIALMVFQRISSEAETLPYDDDQEGLSGQIVFKFSHVVAENTPKGQAADKFAELVYEKSDGAIQIVVFPNGSLYSDIEEINALKDGQVQMIAPSTSKLTRLSEKWGVLDLPYAFTSYAAITEGVHGPIGDELLKSLEADGLKGLAHWPSGFKQLTSNKGPIEKPEDLARQTFRIMQNDIIQSQFNLLGATAKQESFNFTYNLIEAGEVDGEENTISNIYSKKFYTVQDHMTITNHGYLGYAVMMDQDVWNQQTDQTQRILLEAMNETTAWNDENAQKLESEQLQLIKEKSAIRIHELSEKDKLEWEEKLAPVYAEYADAIGAGLLQELAALQKKHLENQ